MTVKAQRDAREQARASKEETGRTAQLDVVAPTRTATAEYTPGRALCKRELALSLVKLGIPPPSSRSWTDGLKETDGAEFGPVAARRARYVAVGATTPCCPQDDGALRTGCASRELLWLALFDVRERTVRFESTSRVGRPKVVGSRCEIGPVRFRPREPRERAFPSPPPSSDGRSCPVRRRAPPAPTCGVTGRLPSAVAICGSVRAAPPFFPLPASSSTQRE